MVSAGQDGLLVTNWKKHGRTGENRRRPSPAVDGALLTPDVGAEADHNCQVQGLCSPIPRVMSMTQGSYLLDLETGPGPKSQE